MSEIGEIETGVEEAMVLMQSWPTECDGCENLVAKDLLGDEKGCVRYAGQEHKQHTRVNGCAMRTHNRKVKAELEFKVNPLKASKRGIKQ